MRFCGLCILLNKYFSSHVRLISCKNVSMVCAQYCKSIDDYYSLGHDHVKYKKIREIPLKIGKLFMKMYNCMYKLYYAYKCMLYLHRNINKKLYQ